MPTARFGAFTGVIGNKIYVIGGLNSSAVSVNEIYDTSTDAWSTGAPMPTARWLGGSGVVNNIFYAIGGATNSGSAGAANVVEAYDPATDTWSTKTPMPITVDSVYSVVDNNIIYVIGGFRPGSGRLASVLAYNPATDAWSTLASLKVGKSNSALGVFGSTIVAAGGLANSDVTKDTEEYNVATNTWTTLTPMPTARNAGCFETVGSMFYIAGGDPVGNTQSPTLASMDAYDMGANSWVGGLSAMPHAVVGGSSASVGGRLYCFGGSNNGNGVSFLTNIFDYVQIYQPDLTPVINPGSVFSATAFGGFTAVSPGSWIEIYGSELATDTRVWAGSDFNGNNAPTSLDQTTVMVGGQSAFIDYISPGQVNALVPSNTPTGLQQLIVKTPLGTSAAYNVTVNGTEPGLLALSSFDINGVQYAVATFPDGSFVLPAGAIAGLTTRAAKAGDVLTLYGVGFGPVTPNIPAGQIVGQHNTLASKFEMSIGGTAASVGYSGLAPGYVGLYQFNVTVPAGVASGNAPLAFTLGSEEGTQTLYIPVGS